MPLPLSWRSARVGSWVEESAPRLEFLDHVRSGLTDARTAKVATLSGGEMQRIRLATSDRFGPRGCVVVLDERRSDCIRGDNDRLIRMLRELQARAHMWFVVEHDRGHDPPGPHVIDLGPARRQGGRVGVRGRRAVPAAGAASLTGDFLAGRSGFRFRPTAGLREHGVWFLEGAVENNLQDVTVEFPSDADRRHRRFGSSRKSTLVDLVRRRVRGRGIGPGRRSPDAAVCAAEWMTS